MSADPAAPTALDRRRFVTLTAALAAALPALGAAAERAGGAVGRLDAHVPRPPAPLRPGAARGGQPDGGPRPAPGRGGGPRARRRALAGPLAWRAVGRQGPAGGAGLSHHLGRRPVPPP